MALNINVRKLPRATEEMEPLDSTDKQDESLPLEKVIVETTRRKQPKNVYELVKMIQETYSFSEKELIEKIMSLQAKGEILLKTPLMQYPRFRNYLLSDQAFAFWITALATLSSISVALLIPENAYPLILARFILGSALVLFLPGYTFLKAIQAKTEVSYLERILFSIGISIFFVFVVGLLLNFTPWGITTVPILFFLSFITICNATIATFNEYKNKKHREL